MNNKQLLIAALIAIALCYISYEAGYKNGQEDANPDFIEVSYERDGIYYNEVSYYKNN